jgi:hypothetical protein
MSENLLFDVPVDLKNLATRIEPIVDTDIPILRYTLEMLQMLVNEVGVDSPLYSRVNEAANCYAAAVLCVETAKSILLTIQTEAK